MSRDMVRHLGGFDLSEGTVMGMSLREARAAWRGVRTGMGLVGAPRLTTEPNGSAKAEHGLVDAVPAAVWMIYLLPSDSSGEWQTCRYASVGCREACLAESGQMGMETNGGRKETGHIYRGRLARLRLLGEAPVAFFRLLVSELDRIPGSKWGRKGFALGLRMNGISDIPFEALGLGWLFERALRLKVTPYDYTAWPSARRDRGGLVYIVDSVKETHTDRQIDAMARPVVVFDVKRGGALPSTWRGRTIVDSDLSDAQWLMPEGTVRGLRYKHVASCTAVQARASGFVRSARP